MLLIGIFVRLLKIVAVAFLYFRDYYFFMIKTSKYTIATAKRPKDKKDILRRRLTHAKASLAIEGLHLSAEEMAVFEECIQRGCSLEERTNLLKERFPEHAHAIRA
ncbi:hypothetical protein [Maridesulfovibrio sp.]|uniref:hypothetical protein n=2 Tax=Maridesulfovibrio sp. TaxID=2795000 RepID=UPI003B005DF1